MSALAIDSFLIVRLTIANAVSKSGTPKIITGTINDVKVTFLKPNKEIIAIIKPRNMEPVSPRKILAGWKLYSKKPSVDPSIIKLKTTSKPSVLPIIKAIIPIVKKKIELTPAAKPSKPSIILIELTIAIIKRRVMG